MNLEAVTFDFWNTLAVDREPLKVRRISAENMIEVLKNQGQGVDLEKMLEAFGKAREVCYRYQEVLGKDFTPVEQVKWIAEYLNIRIDDNLLSQLVEQYTTSLFQIPPQFNSNMERVLRKLRIKYKLAIICNTGRTPGWVIRKLLEAGGLIEFFDVTIFSNEVGIAKPNPDIFRLAVTKLGTRPENTLHVGDDTHTDIYGASQAGLKTAWYNPGEINKPVECDIIISNLNELIDYLCE